MSSNREDQLVEPDVLTVASNAPVSAYDESDVMLDPWIDLPRPTPLLTVVGEFGPVPLPDPPEIPDDGDTRRRSAEFVEVG